MKSSRTITIVAAVLLAVAGFTPVAQAADEWEFQIAPLYLWAVDLGGTMTVRGVEQPFEVKFTDAVKNLEATLTIHFEAWKGDWGVLADFSWLDLGGEQALPGPIGATIGVDFQQTLVELAAGYEFAPEVAVIFGARYNSLDPKISLPLDIVIDPSPSWTDAIAGILWRPSLSDRWTFVGRFDIGAGSSDLVWNAAAFVDYRLGRHAALFFGYRHLDTDYKDEGASFAYDAYQSGPLGAFRFFW
jgi:hypothetical protein